MPGGEEYPAINSSDHSEFQMSKMPYDSKDLLKAILHTVSDMIQLLYPGTVTW